MASNVDSDQMPRLVASDLNLHCLLMHVCPNIQDRYGSLYFEVLTHFITKPKKGGKKKKKKKRFKTNQNKYILGPKRN